MLLINEFSLSSKDLAGHYFKLSTHANDLIDIPRLMMTNLPEPVSEMDIMEMFSFADKNNDGKISWEEFLVFIS